MTQDELRRAILDALKPTTKDDAPILPAGTDVSGKTPAQLQQGSDAYIGTLMSMSPAEISKLPANMQEDFRRAVLRGYQDWREGKG